MVMNRVIWRTKVRVADPNRARVWNKGEEKEEDNILYACDIDIIDFPLFS